MKWNISHFQIFVIVVMVGSGSLVTVSLKWLNKTLARNSNDKIVPFKHPLLESLFMFLGEAFCFMIVLLLYMLRKLQSIEGLRSIRSEGRFRSLMIHHDRA